MSRIGKQPIILPGSVQVNIKEYDVQVKGPKGLLQRKLPEGIRISLQNGSVSVEKQSDSRKHRSLHGLIRTQLENMIRGVSEGFVRQLEINGVGYKADVSQGRLNLSVGYSHPVEILLPDSIQAKSEKSKSTVNAGQDSVLLTLSGPDKEALGQLAAKIRSSRHHEPYKGKGIKYLGERIKRKAGKTGAS